MNTLRLVNTTRFANTTFFSNTTQFSNGTQISNTTLPLNTTHVLNTTHLATPTPTPTLIPGGLNGTNSSGHHGPTGPHLPLWMQRVHVAGGFPTYNPDVPVTSVFLGLFLICAIGHMRTFIMNKKNRHLFVFNVLCMAFCMSRVVTCSLRLAWTFHVQHRPLAIAATVFVAAGVLILFIVNLLFSQRIMRGMHPRLGWHKGLSVFLKIIYVFIPLLLAMIVTASVQMFLTANDKTFHTDFDMLLGGSTFFAFISFLPIPITLLAIALPRKNPDYFGTGSWGRKATVLLIGSTLLCLGACFRTGTAFMPIKPSDKLHPPWYTAKWCFYVFQFTVELIVVLLYLITRIDKLFYVPDGSKKPGDYTNFKFRTSHAVTVESDGSMIEKDAAGVPYGTPEMFHRDFQLELQRRNSSDSDTSTIAPSIAASRIGEKVEVFRREVELGILGVEEAAEILDIDPRRISKNYPESIGYPTLERRISHNSPEPTEYPTLERRISNNSQEAAEYPTLGNTTQRFSGTTTRGSNLRSSNQSSLRALHTRLSASSGRPMSPRTPRTGTADSGRSANSRVSFREQRVESRDS